MTKRTTSIALLLILGGFTIHAAALQITTTTGMIGDIVRNVAGDRADVHVIISGGADPHLYKPTRSDLVKLHTADVIFYNGLYLEGRLNDILERLGRRGRTVVAIATALTESGTYAAIHDGNEHDPHIWMDVNGWRAAVDIVRDTMITMDPDGANRYQANAAAYREQLAALDAYARQTLGSIPEHRRILITAHDAFNYLGRAYGLTVRGIQGMSTESEAGVRDIEELIVYIITQNVPAVFVETSVADKNVRALIEGTRARGHALALGGSLFSDAMGLDATYEGTYIGMIDHNVTTITRALGGTAPAQGMQGKLRGQH